MQDRQKPFSEFQQTKNLWQIPLQIVLEAYLYSTRYLNLKIVVSSCSLFFCLRHQKHTEEFTWPEARFNRKQTSMTPVPYNKLLTNLASSSHTGEYLPLVVLYRPRCARSVLPRPRANIPQYGPRARLVRGLYLLKSCARKVAILTGCVPPVDLVSHC